MEVRNKFVIYIYDDDGVSKNSVSSSLISFKKRWALCEVKRVSSCDIRSGVLQGKGCLVIPGGADLHYCEKLNGLGNKNIQNFVGNGGYYIGICAGAYYATSYIDFTGDGYKISGDRELKLFSGSASGSLAELTEGNFYDETIKSKNLVTLTFVNSETDEFYYHGGPCFDGVEPRQIVAYYSTGDVAVIRGHYGKGGYLLSGVHFELCPKVYLANLCEKLDGDSVFKEQRIIKKLQQKNYGHLLYKVVSDVIGQ